jgi:hypothetical protein
MSFHKKPPSATSNGTSNPTSNVAKDDDNKKDKEEEEKDNDTDDDDGDDDDNDVIALDEDEEEEGKEASTTKNGEALSSQQQQTPSKKQSQSQPQSQPQPPTSLGKVEGLRTDHPTFTIPFPHLRKNLVFPGKKVPTSSKYIMLACSNKQKGSVQCKVCMYFHTKFRYKLSCNFYLFVFHPFIFCFFFFLQYNAIFYVCIHTLHAEYIFVGDCVW